jgi:hypothetical protein
MEGGGRGSRASLMNMSSGRGGGAVMNNNSSRFGKYLEIRFDAMGAVTGAELSDYLLEKSRLTMHGPGEQNYHIFYYLFPGLPGPQRAELRLAAPKDFKYLGGPADDDADHRERFHEVLRALGDLGFEGEDIQSLIRLLAGMLHLGQIEFAPGSNVSGTLSWWWWWYPRVLFFCNLLRPPPFALRPLFDWLICVGFLHH